MTAEQLREIADKKQGVWKEYDEVQRLLKEAAEEGCYYIEYFIEGERDCGFAHPRTAKRLIEDGVSVRYYSRTGNVNKYIISFS